MLILIGIQIRRKDKYLYKKKKLTNLNNFKFILYISKIFNP